MVLDGEKDRNRVGAGDSSADDDSDEDSDSTRTPYQSHDQVRNSLHSNFLFYRKLDLVNAL